MVKNVKQEMSFSKAKQRGMVWVRVMHKYNLESMGMAPGLPHPHRTFDDTLICTRHTDSRSIFFSHFPICANSGCFVPILTESRSFGPILAESHLFSIDLGRVVLIKSHIF